MEHSFDTEIAREGTNSLKWEFVQDEHSLLQFNQTARFFGKDRVLPLWVADMDFRCPAPVVEALSARAEHGIYGYSAPTEAFYDSVVSWMKRRHQWAIEPDWICITPGVVPALNMLVRTYISQGDKVLIQPPVYYPFYMAVENNQAEVAANPLLYEEGTYRMDLADLESKARDSKVKMAILCSPHNPVGRVWTKDELMEFGQICAENDVLIVSDEIHGDLVHDGYTFVPFASLDHEFAQRSIICTAPSKTFNMAGLLTSCIIIPDENLRSRFEETLLSNGLIVQGCFGLTALQVAYDQGEKWLEQVRAYIESNLEYLEEYIEIHMPQIRVVRPEGTYLVWLDCRGLGLEGDNLSQLIMEEAKVYLDNGNIFGPEGEGFQRINLACPRPLLTEALDRINYAISELNQQN
ncbi:MAG: MalY/PatB family protein [Anaerolineales bacterium]